MSICCINGRFCWEQSDFPGWEQVIDPKKSFCLIPYRNWTPPALIGNGERYLEFWQRDDAFDLLGGCCGVCRLNEKFALVNRGMTLDRFDTIQDAVNSLFLMNGDPVPFVPDAFYRKGSGRLEALLDDPESVLIIVSTWKRYYRQEHSFLSASAEDNRNSLNHYRRGQNSREKAYQRAQIFREKAAHFNYEIMGFDLRCGGKSDQIEPRFSPCCDYSLCDYRGDGFCVVLNKSCHSEVAIEFLKSSTLERVENFGITAIFVKEKEECYALGSCAEDFFAPTDDHNTLREIRNYYEEIPLRNARPLAALFEFLTRLHNLDFIRFEGTNVPPRVEVPFIEEELPRGNVIACGSFGGAMMFYQSNRPVRRTQWNRIEAPHKHHE